MDFPFYTLLLITYLFISTLILIKNKVVTILFWMKAMLLIHVLGDYFSDDFWEAEPIRLVSYDFMTAITMPMRELGNSLLLLGLLLIDVAYLIASLLNSKNLLVLRSNQIRTPFYLIFGLFIKLSLLGYLSLLKGEFTIDIKPEDTLGISAFIHISEFLIPMGLVFRHDLSKDLNYKNILVDFVLLLLISSLSHSKAQIINYIITYLIPLSLFYGVRKTFSLILNIRFIPLLIPAFILIALKTQLRSNQEVAIEKGNIVSNVIGGASARLLGGIHRAFIYMTDSIVTRHELTMGGAYHSQLFTLLIPRAFWPDKPRIASEQICYYLDLSYDGTSFAVNLIGAMICDFGILGILIIAPIAGLFFYVLEALMLRKINRTGELTNKNLLIFLLLCSWLSEYNQLAEGGLVSGISGFLISSIFSFLAWSLYRCYAWLFYRNKVTLLY